MARKKRSKKIEPEQVATHKDLPETHGDKNTIADLPETHFLHGDEEGAEVMRDIPRGQFHPDSRNQGGRPFGAERDTYLPEGMKVETVRDPDGKVRDGMREVYDVSGKTMSVTLRTNLKHDGSFYKAGETVELPVALIQRKPWLCEAGSIMEEYRAALAQNIGSALDKYNILFPGR